ncbi:MAG: hypothetical protein QOJ12_3062 [Thermoleophilales bacterium]|nr:hypothetical protein [Thermoleophilales bacterium]
MEIVLREQTSWDLTAAVYRHAGRLYATGDLRAWPNGEPLEPPLMVINTFPVVVAGRLPEGVVGVHARPAGCWRSVQVTEDVWLACALHDTPPDPLSELEFVRGDGRREPVPRPSDEQLRLIAYMQDAQAGRAAPEPIAHPGPEGQAYAAVLAESIADDVLEHPATGVLLRAVIRWFWNGDPLYLTIHVIGIGDEQPDADDAWGPLVWPNADREFLRTDRILARPELQRAGAALRTSFEPDDDGMPETDAHLPAVYEAVRLLPSALRARGVPLAERFAVTAAHFEGWGGLEALEHTAPVALVAALREYDELPKE